MGDKDNKILDKARNVAKDLRTKYPGVRDVKTACKTIEALMDRLRRMGRERDAAVAEVARLSKEYSVCDNCIHWPEQCEAYKSPDYDDGAPLPATVICGRCHAQSEWGWGGGLHG